MVGEGLAKGPRKDTSQGPRKDTPPVPKPMTRPGGGEKAKADAAHAQLKANESARFNADQAPYDEATLEGDMETSGAFRAAATEEGDVPSWDASDLKDTVMGGMGMAPELDLSQHKFARMNGMVEAADLPVTEEKKKKQPKQKVDMKAMVLGTADIYDTQMEEEEPSAKEAWEKEKGMPSMIVDPELLQEAAQPGVKDIEKAAGPLVGGPAEEAALKQAVEAETAALPEEKKRGMLQGALNLGVQLTTLVNDGAAAMADRLSRNCAGSNSLYCRLALSTKTLFKTRADNTRRLLEGEDGILSRKGVAKAASVYSWARAASAIGAFGGAEIARRTSMAALGVAGTSLEIAKEARLKNMDLRERVGAERVKDMDVAAEEAWALYEEAKVSAKGKPPTAEQLSNKFGERLPKALLERLAKKPEGVAMGFAERLAEKDLRRTLEKIQAKMDAIENGSGTDAEKRARREQLMAGGVIAKQWGSYLKDADRFLTAAGTVDMLGYGARAAERTAKGARTALVLLSLGALAKRGWDAFSTHETFAPSAVGGESVQPEAIPPVTAAGTDYEVMTAESRDLPPGIVSMETIGAGGSITGSLMKQLEEHPEKFGYAGNPRSSEELHAWAFRSAKQMAKSAGFLTRKDQQDTWLSAAAIGKLHIGVDMSHGKPELAMVDADGHVMSAAELKAGPYGMKVPFEDAEKGQGGETPVAPEIMPPSENPIADAQNYYVKKALGKDAFDALTSAQRADLGKRFLQIHNMQEMERDPATSESSRLQYHTAQLSKVKEVTELYKDALPVSWQEKLEKAAPYADVLKKGRGVLPVVENHTAPEPVEEKKLPAPPVPKPFRRPVAPVEPTPEPAPAPLLVLDGVEHPEWAEAHKQVLTPDFNNLSTDPNDPQSKNVALLILQRAHEAKEILAKLPPGAPVPPAVTERIAELKEFVNESILSTVLKPDWFEKV